MNIKVNELTIEKNSFENTVTIEMDRENKEVRDHGDWYLKFTLPRARKFAPTADSKKVMDKLVETLVKGWLLDELTIYKRSIGVAILSKEYFNSFNESTNTGVVMFPVTSDRHSNEVLDGNVKTNIKCGGEIGIVLTRREIEMIANAIGVLNLPEMALTGYC